MTTVQVVLEPLSPKRAKKQAFDAEQCMSDIYEQWSDMAFEDGDCDASDLERAIYAVMSALFGGTFDCASFELVLNTVVDWLADHTDEIDDVDFLKMRDPYIMLPWMKVHALFC